MATMIYGMIFGVNIFKKKLGDKCYGSTDGSNPSSQGSTPWSPANINET